VFGPWLFDVAAAIRLLDGTTRPTRPLPVTPWAHAYGLTSDSGAGRHSAPLMGCGPGFDPGYAMTTDLSEPVIIATVPGPWRATRAAADRRLCTTGHCPLSGALRLLSVTGAQWQVVLTRRGMPRLSELLPGEVDPGGPIDDLDVWLDREDVPDGVPFLVSPTLDYDIDLNRYFLRPVMIGAALNTRLAAAGDLCRFLRFLHGSRGGKSWRDAAEEDHSAFLHWRRFEPAGPRVAASTWNRELALVNGFFSWAARQRLVVLPGTEDADEGGIDAADVGVIEGPATGVAAGPWWCWCRWSWVRCRCQVSVYSETAARAACSSTMALPAAKVATSAWMARLLTARG